MQALTEEALRLFSRLGKTQDGKDFVEFLMFMQQRNYDDIISSDRTVRDEQVGFGLCLKEILALFEKCDDKLKQMERTEAPDRI